MHGTFNAVRQRVIQREKPQGNRSIAMWLGGVPWDQQVDIAVSSCILSALLTLTTVTKVYETRLHDAEVASILKARTDSATEFLQAHLIKPLQDSGVEAPGITEAINRLLVRTGGSVQR
jgi:hypothetical protein